MAAIRWQVGKGRQPARMVKEDLAKAESAEKPLRNRLRHA
jgi:hypothetical protein